MSRSRGRPAEQGPRERAESAERARGSEKEKIFVRTRSVIGRQVELCHPARSRHKGLEIVKAFKDGSLDNADFWLDIKGDKILIRYFPVRDDDGTYLGVLEVTQSIGWIQKLEESKRLL